MLDTETVLLEETLLDTHLVCNDPMPDDPCEHLATWLMIYTDKCSCQWPLCQCCRDAMVDFLKGATGTPMMPCTNHVRTLWCSAVRFVKI